MIRLLSLGLLRVISLGLFISPGYALCGDDVLHFELLEVEKSAFDQLDIEKQIQILEAYRSDLILAEAQTKKSISEGVGAIGLGGLMLVSQQLIPKFPDQYVSREISRVVSMETEGHISYEIKNELMNVQSPMAQRVSSLARGALTVGGLALIGVGTLALVSNSNEMILEIPEGEDPYAFIKSQREAVEERIADLELELR